MNFDKIFGSAENGTMTLEQFKEAIKDMKLVDLNTGDYVSKKKYDDEVSTLNSQIETLNGTITTRDTDLEALQKQLTEAGADVDKLSNVSEELTKLQAKYDSDTKGFKEQLKKQAYEFAVKEFANGKKFTSNAAKRDFVNSMIAKELKMEKDSILGADDFVTAYSKDNADAFVVEEPETEQQQVDTKPQPKFVGSTQGAEKAPDTTGGFIEAFNFTGIRPKG